MLRNVPLSGIGISNAQGAMVGSECVRSTMTQIIEEFRRADISSTARL
jgi:hypothetical protein